MFILHIYNIGRSAQNFTGRNYFPVSQNIFGGQTFSPLSFDQFSYGFGIGIENTYGYSNGPSNLDQILNHIEQSYNFGYNSYNYNYNPATQPTYLDCIFNNIRHNPYIYNFINSENSNSAIDRALYPIDLFLNQRGLNVRFSNYGLYSSNYYSPTDCAARNILNLLDRACQDSSRPIKNSRNSKNTKNTKNKNLALA